jgi:hypothetical protein
MMKQQHFAVAGWLKLMGNEVTKKIAPATLGIGCVW